MSDVIPPPVFDLPRASRQHRRIIVALLVIIAALAIWAVVLNTRWYAISRMRPTERRALYTRVLDHAKALCGSHQAALAGDCENELELLAEFPECDAGCQSFIEQHRAPSGK